MKNMTSVLLIFSIFTLPSFLTSTEAEYLYHVCPNTTTFTPNSTFQSNLNRLFSTLSSNAYRSTGFYNTSVQTPNNAVYGLFLCRGDVLGTDACETCVANATSEAPQRCPIEKEAVIWYDDCMLRYSYVSFFSTSAENPGVFLMNTQNVTEQTRFNQVLAASMNEVATEAANDAYKFATKQTKFSDLITLYSLAQCTQDLSAAVCDECLRDVIALLPSCCSGKQGGRVLLPSCSVRLDDIPLMYLGNKTKVTANESRFYQVLEASVNELAVQASNKSNMFATKKADVSGSISLQVLGQCTQDLSPRDCYLCLQGAIAEVPRIQQGGRLLCPSCRLTIEVYRYILRTPSFPPPLPPPPASIRARPKGRSRLSPYIIIIGSILAFIAVTVVLVYCFASRRAVRNNAPSQENVRDDTETLESLQFDLGTIETATNKFSDNNKLGEGGFGVVFKGTLANEQEIAVKRLSKSSKQGVQEFKNEVALVAKLQHRNLVRLLGFCLEGEETILVYEYVPNQSLDYFLFESKKREQLDWSRRCMIIGGITQGIVYLHEYSRLRVIHRDLKASNILLDENMNPKISDFGMARMFGADDQTQGNTERIVGT
ncbi:cysteine-rich receptor-like protein kinase 25 isoform X7 [Malus domestica]